MGQPVVVEVVGLATTMRTRLGAVVVRSRATVIGCVVLLDAVGWAAVRTNTTRSRKETRRAPSGARGAAAAPGGAAASRGAAAAGGAAASRGAAAPAGGAA